MLYQTQGENMKLYVIYDKAAQQSSPVFEAKNDAVAAREFRKVLQNLKDPAVPDYRLYCIGIFDQETMALLAVAPPAEIVIPAIPVSKDEADQLLMLDQHPAKE